MANLCPGVSIASVLSKNRNDQHLSPLVTKNKVSSYCFCDKTKLTQPRHPAIDQAIQLKITITVSY